MKLHLLYIGLLALVLAMGSCSGKKAEEKEAPQVDTIPMMVMQIQKCSRLYTAECHLHKIVTHDDVKTLKGSLFSHDFNVRLPLGSRKVAIPMDATVKAYIDFDGFSEKNVRRNGQKIEIVLPDPKLVLTSTKIDHKDVKAYVATLRSDFTDEELSRFEQQGREAIIGDLAQLDIMEQARVSAARTLVPIVTRLGYDEANITVTFRKDRFSPDDIKQMIRQ